MKNHRAIVMAGRVESVNVSRGGVPKTAVAEARVGPLGVDGDRQRDRRYHGGSDRAVVVFSLDVIRALQREGHPISPGAAGENLTVSGFDWASIGPGARLRVGDVELEITRYASPCETIRHCFVGADFTRISQKTHAGWSRLCARVLAGGIVRPGDQVLVHDR